MKHFEIYLDLNFRWQLTTYFDFGWIKVTEKDGLSEVCFTPEKYFVREQ